MNTANNQTALHCNECNHKTYHEIIANVALREIIPEDIDGTRYEFWEDTVVQSLRCPSCKSFSFRTFTIWCDDAPDFPEKNEMLFPKRGTESIPLASKFKNVPASIIGIYKETVDAYNSEINLLCAGGVRASIEAICADKKIGGNNLKSKIDGLFDHGYITKNHSESLHELRFLGNEALHKLSQPTKKELRTAIEIIGHTLDLVYEFPPKAEELKVKRQERKQASQS